MSRQYRKKERRRPPKKRKLLAARPYEGFIVKVQMSLAGNGARSSLTYNEDRSVFYETDKPEEVEAVVKLLGGGLKGYFAAALDENGKLHIGERTEDQAW